MKYILDIILVIAVVWVVNLWNGQRLNGLVQSDEIARLTARVDELQGLKDLAKQAYHVNAPKEEKASGGEE